MAHLRHREDTEANSPPDLHWAIEWLPLTATGHGERPHWHNLICIWRGCRRTKTSGVRKLPSASRLPFSFTVISFLLLVHQRQLYLDVRHSRLLYSCFDQLNVSNACFSVFIGSEKKAEAHGPNMANHFSVNRLTTITFLKKHWFTIRNDWVEESSWFRLKSNNFM